MRRAFDGLLVEVKRRRYGDPFTGHLFIFVGNPNIPIDNDISERLLRITAKCRATYLPGSKDKCGQNLAMLMSVVHSAAAHGHSQEACLADVLERVLNHLINRLAELLPRNWKDRLNRSRRRLWTLLLS